MKHPLYFIPAIFIVVWITALGSTRPTRLKVAGGAAQMIDGDTISLPNQTIRLACIDAPESNQPGGEEATLALRSILQSDFTVEMVDVDRYGRQIGLLTTESGSVQLQLVKTGHAWVYTPYLNHCPALAPQLLEAQLRAQSQDLGLWADPNPINPADWRRL